MLANVRVKNIRPEYKNLKEWMKDPDNFYIGRKGVVFIDGERFPKQDSKWCNPYKINNSNTRDDVLEKYKVYIEKKLKDKELDLEELKGKTLGCWCHPEKCHGDILLELIGKCNMEGPYVQKGIRTDKDIVQVISCLTIIYNKSKSPDEIIDVDSLIEEIFKIPLEVSLNNLSKYLSLETLIFYLKRSIFFTNNAKGIDPLIKKIEILKMK